jgi:predicted GIY-YIG superfamily endonuclease
MTIVYLLHFAEKLHHAQHYLGSADDLEARLACHRSGNGARLMEVINEHGIPWQLARTWPGDRTLERRLKRRKEGRRLCPICNPRAARRAAS